MDTKVIEQIQKLLNLGNNTNFKGEADVALSKAYELMSKNNISYAEIDAHQRDQILGDLGQTDMFDGKFKKFYKWEKLIVLNIAKLFDCQIIIQKVCGGKKSKIIIIGRQSNTITSELMINWLLDKINKESSYMFKYNRNKWTGYCLGIAAGIQETVKKIKGTKEEEKEGWGLVKVNEVKEYVAQNFKIKTKDIGPLRGSASAWNQGKEYGKSIALNKQFGLKAIGSC